MAVVTVSRQLGSAGDLIAAAAARELGYDHVDKDLITEVAKEANVSEEEVERFDEQATSPVKQFLHSLITPSKSVPVPPAMLWGLEYPYEVSASLLAEDGADSEDRHFLDHDSYQQFLRAAVERLHGRAQIVIVGRGGQAILKDREDVVHVRTVAPMDHRIRTVRDRYGVDEGEAKDMIRSSDKRKSAYVKTNYNLDWSDPANYHVILNTGTVPGTVAASLVKSAVNALEGTSA